MSNKANAGMKYSQRVLNKAKESEGFSEIPYLDTLAKPPVWTRGYGDTHFDASEKTVPITEHDASENLCKEMDGCNAAVLNLVTVHLTRGQLDALVDFVYNEGSGHLEESHLLAFLNAGHPELAALELPKWNLAGGVVEPGLVKRRELEKEWFLETPATPPADVVTPDVPLEQPTLLGVLGGK